MTDDLLQQIQELQFQDRVEAERRVLGFIQGTFPDLNCVSAELRPQAVSLNSFNGFLTLDNGQRYFFKTHTESDTVINEYYNARMLEDVGYPVIKPLHQSTQVGKQLLIYEIIEEPSLFDLAWEIEHSDAADPSVFEPLMLAQNREDDSLFGTYLRSLKPLPDSEIAKAPIHQLFYHRLVGGRLERFYDPDIEVQLPGLTVKLSEMRRMRWTINGRKYRCSLNDLIEDAMRLLAPEQPGPTIVGHGDAHNGNVFFRQRTDPPSLLYFDPAFAGRHHPLLDLTKPLFHNVFAMWMYFPREIFDDLRISLRQRKRVYEVHHNFRISEIRRMFLRSKVDRVLIPILQEIQERGLLRTDWRQFLKAALFCCPLLTLNLADSDKFPPEIALLGFAMAMEMGADSEGERSLIDRTLDEVERVLAIRSRPPSDRWYR